MRGRKKERNENYKRAKICIYVFIYIYIYIYREREREVGEIMMIMMMNGRQSSKYVAFFPDSCHIVNRNLLMTKRPYF